MLPSMVGYEYDARQSGVVCLRLPMHRDAGAGVLDKHQTHFNREVLENLPDCTREDKAHSVTGVELWVSPARYVQ